MNEYIYKCFDCNKTYGKDEVEKNLLYLCSTCGKVEKNQPLKGILLVEYDYDSIKKKISLESFFNYELGKFWQYSFLFPLDKSKLDSIPDKLAKITLPSNCVQKLNYEGRNFFVLNETCNPTLSFKDRASSLVALKAIEMGITKIAAASTGNAGSSLAGICARLGLESVIFVPKNIPEAKRIQIQSYGAELILVDGDYDLAFDTCIEISSQKNWYIRNTAYNPLTIEGKKSAAYDIFISTKGKMPDVVFIPTGDGVILSGFYKGLAELKKLGLIEKLPKLISVQAEGSDCFARFYIANVFEYKSANSIADSICAGAPRALYYGAEAIEKTNGSVIVVSDEEIIEAQKITAKQFGMLLEPSSAASFAAYKKFIKLNENQNETYLLLFTGNGLKDISSLSIWNDPVVPLTPSQIKDKFF
ncbi:MAG: Threonine synthase [Ignavibacteria bacterium]|nr:MAG: Threonine synthase [Ignavibacteria bacterium]KAF0159140.1 MAG: Threonine synthase [Ignavibacteria bacterium]